MLVLETIGIYIRRQQINMFCTFLKGS